MSALRGLIVDVDGTLVRGDTVVDGAVDAIDRLRSRGIDCLFLSNNPTESQAAYADRLRSLGFEVDPDAVLTAASITAEWLADEYPNAPHLVFGSDGLRTELDAHGITMTDNPDEAAVVVASYDESFDYGGLRTALWAFTEGSPALIGTDPDIAIPTDDRPIPGSGAVLRAVAGIAERDPDVVAGKPSAIARRAALDRIGHAAADCLVVGDRLNTDIALGAGTELRTALVLSGITDRDDLAAAEIDPDLVLDSIADLPDRID